MSDPADMIMPMLREMREENRLLHGATAERPDVVERRLKKLEEAQVSYRQALTSDTLMSRLLTGEFEERIEAREKQVQELEAHK